MGRWVTKTKQFPVKNGVIFSLNHDDRRKVSLWYDIGTLSSMWPFFSRKKIDDDWLGVQKRFPHYSHLFSMPSIVECPNTCRFFVCNNFRFFATPFLGGGFKMFQTFFYVHPYLGKIPILTSIYFKGVVQPPTRFLWYVKHSNQLVLSTWSVCAVFFGVRSFA